MAWSVLDSAKRTWRRDMVLAIGALPLVCVAVFGWNWHGDLKSSMTTLLFAFSILWRPVILFGGFEAGLRRLLRDPGPSWATEAALHSAKKMLLGGMVMLLFTVLSIYAAHIDGAK